MNYMFFAYPNRPQQIGTTIEAAISKINSAGSKITSWKAMDVVGNLIGSEVLKNVEKNATFVADISKLNFNVSFEVGFAIGQSKPLVLTKNRDIAEGSATIREVGIFDTIGFAEYDNSDELFEILKANNSNILYQGNIKLNNKAPVYVLETKIKTDFLTRITARIKKARLTYRSFDPNEAPRLSVHEAIDQVAQAYGVVIPLLSKDSVDHEVHNLRGAFLAGLAIGMNKVCSILQYGEDPVPIDYRDLVNVYYDPDDINEYIADFANDIVDSFQKADSYIPEKDVSYLQKVDLGSSAAENEMRTLQAYYLKTDNYLTASRGEAQLVVGRKGSGKSAIFLQIRDKERSKGKNIVLDLKPDGYKLLKFKELILDYLQEGTFQHTIMAFWEYILLLEICHRILETDKQRHNVQSELYLPYIKLEELYKAESYISEGDFSERMSILMDNITINYKTLYGTTENVRLSEPEVTALLYKTDIKVLRDNLVKYLKFKDKIWLLFDNVDKGWPATGLKHDDFIVIRTLIDATRKIERYFDKEKIELYPIIFLRNDVYELLVAETSDRQKEAKVILDWVDPDLLREIIKLRITSSLQILDEGFDILWRKLCISHYKGEETSEYLIERSLMRPRFLINLINHCKSFAVNLNHNKISEDDILKGVNAYSVDLLMDISYEIRDILPQAEDLLFGFISSSSTLSRIQLETVIADTLNDTTNTLKIIDLLLWYGFLGVKIDNHTIKYIYHVSYSLQLLKGLIQKKKDDIVFAINPGFWPSLMIEG